MDEYVKNNFEIILEKLTPVIDFLAVMFTLTGIVVSILMGFAGYIEDIYMMIVGGFAIGGFSFLVYYVRMIGTKPIKDEKIK